MAGTSGIEWVASLLNGSGLEIGFDAALMGCLAFIRAGLVGMLVLVGASIVTNHVQELRRRREQKRLRQLQKRFSRYNYRSRW